MPRGRAVDLLEVSLAAVRCLVASGGSASVAQMAASAGVSQRTFHRSFPTKEDVLRPLMRDATTALAEIMAGRPQGEGAVEAFSAAYAATAGGLYAKRTRALLPVVYGDDALSAVWEHEARASEVLLEPLVIARTHGGDDAGARARALTTVLLALAAASLRRAAVSHEDPVTLFCASRDALALLRDDDARQRTEAGRASRSATATPAT